MFSVFTAAWRVLIKRVAADWLILAAAMVTIITATVVLAAGPIYAEAVNLSGLHRSLADAPVAESNLEISLKTQPNLYSAADTIVAAEAERVFSATGGIIVRQISTEAYELPMQVSGDLIDLAEIQFLDRVAEYATFDQGRWPDAGSTPFEVATSDLAAQRLGLELGDSITLVNRRDRNIRPSITVGSVSSPCA